MGIDAPGGFPADPGRGFQVSQPGHLDAPGTSEMVQQRPFSGGADAVFAEMHLVSCRNVLIYFDRALQDRALGLFKDSLPRKGFLGLGSKESLRFSDHADAFTEFVREDKIYQKVTA